MARFPPGAGSRGTPDADGPFSVRGIFGKPRCCSGSCFARHTEAGGPGRPLRRRRRGRRGPGRDRGRGERAAPVWPARNHGRADRGERAAARSHGRVLPADVPRRGVPAAGAAATDSAAAARRQLDLLVAGDARLRRVWQVIDVILAILRARSAWDWRSIRAASTRSTNRTGGSGCGCTGRPSSRSHSGFIRGIYDLVFAFEDGDATRPRLAAGVALRGAMRMFFTYRGALFWRMTAGMGDVVFAPLYQVLKQRGVRFEFFHRLQQCGLSPEADPGLASGGARIRRAGEGRGRWRISASGRRAQRPGLRPARSDELATGERRSSGRAGL